MNSMTWLGITSTYERVNSGVKGSDGKLKPGYAWDYEVDFLGYKYYMIDILACIALEQMKKLPKHLKIRQDIQTRYNNELHPIVRRPPWSDTVQYYCSRIPVEHRNNLIEYLADKKIHTSVHFKPLHKYDIVKQDREYPVADAEWLKLVSLPVHPGMSDEDVDYVIYWVNEYFNEFA